MKELQLVFFFRLTKIKEARDLDRSDCTVETELPPRLESQATLPETMFEVSRENFQSVWREGVALNHPAAYGVQVTSQDNTDNTVGLCQRDQTCSALAQNLVVTQ